MNERIQEIQQQRLDPNTPSLTRIELTNELAHLIVRKTTEGYDGTRD